MSEMSRQSTEEYINVRKRRYSCADNAKKTRIIDEVVDTTGLSRKYVISLLNGTIRYRPRTGRGKTYGQKTAEVLAAVWREAGCPCSTYLKAEMPRWLDEYEQFVANIDADIRAQLAAMSASTMDRALKGLPRVKPGYTRANRRSGRNNPIKAAIPCKSGEEVMACHVLPGDVQVDTFALGGGDPSDNFFWILDGTDRRTQWTEISPAWNRGQHATLEALKRIERRIPFAIASLHCDNGGEILNYHVAAFLGRNRPNIALSRSRPRRCNDNAHVEERNRSVGRELFGERRIDDLNLLDDLVRLCEEWSDFCNFFRPSKMLVGKEKRPDGKGWRCRYDKPKTPYLRVLESGVLTDAQRETLTARRSKLNGIELRHRLVKRLRRICRRQEQYAAAKKSHDKIFLESALADSALRAAPPGTSASCALQVGGISLLPKPLSKKKQHQRSTQQLTNQNNRPHPSGTLSI